MASEFTKNHSVMLHSKDLLIVENYVKSTLDFYIMINQKVICGTNIHEDSFEKLFIIFMIKRRP